MILVLVYSLAWAATICVAAVGEARRIQQTFFGPKAQRPGRKIC